MLVKGVNMSALIKLLIGSKIQAYLGDTVGQVPEHLKKASPNLFGGGGSCLPFVKKQKTKKNTQKTTKKCNTCHAI